MTTTNKQVIDAIEIALEGIFYMEPTREREIAKTKLEEAAMWLAKADSE